MSIFKKKQVKKEIPEVVKKITEAINKAVSKQNQKNLFDWGVDNILKELKVKGNDKNKAAIRATLHTVYHFAQDNNFIIDEKE